LKNEREKMKDIFKKLELAKDGKDYAYPGYWLKAIEIGTDERFLFWVATRNGNCNFSDDYSLDMLNMILEHEKENGDSGSIAEMANSIFEDGDAYFPRDDINGGADIDDVTAEVKQIWSDKLMKLAIEKATTKEDEEYINEFLEFQDMDIETFKKDKEI